MEHCKEKSRLADELTRAAEAYSKSGKALRAKTDGDVSKVLDDLKQTYDECSKARRALQAHILKHRC